MHSGSRPTVAVIDITNLRANLRACREFIGTDIKVMGVVKADAYGHGAAECSLALEAEGVDWLGVAMPEEGAELRAVGVSIPILCLGGFWPGQESLLIKQGLTPVIFEMENAERLNKAANALGVIVPVHVKIDTGMGRLGFSWQATAEKAFELRKFPHLEVAGMMTHFASADDLASADFTALQVSRFYDAVSAFRAAGHSPNVIDLSNSPGSVVNGANGGNLVRLGGIIYGIGNDILPAGMSKPELRPVLALISQISQLKTVSSGESIGYGRTYIVKRDSVIAAVPIGYHDGYRRALSNSTYMIVRGRRAPVVGRISMDWTTIDVTNVPDVSLGDEVTIIGGQTEMAVTAEDLAKQADTVSYEITCGISRRVPRRFVGKITD